MSVVVRDIPPWVQYIATAGQTVFVVNCLFFTETDLNVYSLAPGAVANDVADILTYNVDYTVSINPAPTVGGTITLTVGAVLNTIITIFRNQPDERLNNYQNGGPFEAPVVNPDFQQIVLMTQQNKYYDIMLAPHYNVSATPVVNVDNILPLLPAGSSWRKNSAGTAIEAYTAPSGGVVVPTFANAVVKFADTVGTLTSSGMFYPGNYNTIFPNVQGAASSIAVNDGTGNLTWTVIPAPSSIPSFTNPSIVNAVPKFSNTTGAMVNSGLIVDNTNNVTGANSIVAGQINISVVNGVISNPTSGVIQIVDTALLIRGNTAGISMFPISAGSPSAINFADGANTNFVAFKAQNAAMAASSVYILPSDTPTTAGQFLTSTVAGGGTSTMSWAVPTVTQTIVAVSSAATNTNAVIPLDNTIPQSNEGTQLITATITPDFAGSLLVEFYCPIFQIATNPQYGLFTLFKNGTANALSATVAFVGLQELQGSDPIYLKYIHTPAVPGVAITFSIRYGTSLGDTISLLTAGAVPATLGGILQMSLTIKEIT